MAFVSFDASPKSARWAALLPTWPLSVALAAFIRLVAQPRALLNDPDTYLHIAAGNWIAANRALPVADPFSYTMAGARWVPGEWLAELCWAAIYNVAGWSGVVVAAAACVAVSSWLLCHFVARRIGGLPAAIAAVVGVALVLPHAVARPHLLAMPLLVLWSGALFRARDDDRPPPWGLLAIAALWANLHASVLFGLGLAGWLAAEATVSGSRSRWRWVMFVLAAACAGLLTPNGIEAYLQPLRLMAMPALQSSFGEWLPPSLFEFPALGIWLAGLVAASLLLDVRLNLSRLGLLLLLIYMALSHVRHADLLGLVGPLVVASAFGERVSSRPAGAPRAPAVALVLALAAAVALPLAGRPLARDGDAVTPAAALAEARRLGLSGPVFNGEGFGGYLAFAGVPDFIDGRVELFGNEFLAEDVAAEGGDAVSLPRLLDRYGVTWTLLAPQAGAIAVLDRLPGWRRVYADPVAVIHVRTTQGSR